MQEATCPSLGVSGSVRNRVQVRSKINAHPSTSSATVVYPVDANDPVSTTEVIDLPNAYKCGREFQFVILRKKFSKWEKWRDVPLDPTPGPKGRPPLFVIDDESLGQ